MFNLKIFNKVIYIMVDISNDNINTINNTINNTMNKLDKTTLYFLSNRTYLNKLNNNLICDNIDDIKEDFIQIGLTYVVPKLKHTVIHKGSRLIRFR